MTYFVLTVVISWTAIMVIVGPGAFPLRWSGSNGLGRRYTSPRWPARAWPASC